jgi:urease accessory protein
MLCSKIVGNVFKWELTNSELDGFEKVNFTWDECAKRILRKHTSLGREIGISLPIGTTIHHGDILFQEESEESKAILAYNLKCELLVVSSYNIREFGRIAYELGNRHLPLEITEDGEILLLPDQPTKLLLNKLNAHYVTQFRRFSPIAKGGGHHHDHE